jgi:hypothetical protein
VRVALRVRLRQQHPAKAEAERHEASAGPVASKREAQGDGTQG